MFSIAIHFAHRYNEGRRHEPCHEPASAISGGGEKLESNELARRIVEIASDHKAEDIVMLDISRVSIIADYFVICTGTSARHIRAVAREIDQQLGRAGVNPINIEGMEDATWVLMDYGAVIVHIFDDQTRNLYRLEQLWAGAQPVLVVQ
jgi:ribosome-associated protein